MIIMVTNTRSKNTRQRGSKTHGWGSMKKHRGAGHRGGRGAAGSGKRGDAKKPSIWSVYPNNGKKGFSSKSRTKEVSITIAYLETFTKTLAKEGQKNNTLNLEALGYTKLLATGKPTKKWSITVAKATPKAIEKIKNAGGSITLTSVSKDAETTSEE